LLAQISTHAAGGDKSRPPIFSTSRHLASSAPSVSGATSSVQSAFRANRPIAAHSSALEATVVTLQPAGCSSASRASRVVKSSTPSSAAKSAATALTIARASANNEAFGGSPQPQQPPPVKNSYKKIFMNLAAKCPRRNSARLTTMAYYPTKTGGTRKSRSPSGAQPLANRFL
jgi:hypothetical protein